MDASGNVEPGMDDPTQAWREVFSFFDKDGDNTISRDHLGIAMRSFGLNITEAELEKITDEADPDRTGLVHLQRFLFLMERETKKAVAQAETVDPVNELREALAVFEQKNSMISPSLARRILTSKGEPLTDEEIVDFMKTMCVNERGLISMDEMLVALTHDLTT